MYLSQTDLLEMDHDQLVGKILMRMTPWQFETRCTRNVVHFILSEQQRSNPIWSNPAVHTLLGKGPRFIPKARSLTTTEVQTACARLGYRLVRAFERYVDGGYHEMRRQAMKEEGIRAWAPRQRQLSASFCRSYVSSFFKCQRVDGGAWRGNQLLSPSLDRCISSIEYDIISTASTVRTCLAARLKRPNLNSAESAALKSVQSLDVGYNISDKNYGPTVYSRELAREQCRLHLEDQEKGTYRKIVDETKEEILEGILLKLRSVLCRFKGIGNTGAWDFICSSILRNAEEAVKGGRLCAFYIIWKLHKASTANGLRSRPIAAAINYVTGSASHFLHCQLQGDVWKHPHVLRDSLDLIRILEERRFESAGRAMLTSADVVALYPSIRLEQGMIALQWFMDHHTDFNPTLKDLCLKLAHFVLTNNYVECKELNGTMYQQVVGTAMGTSFSVVYAIIFMIWLETPIVESERFRSCIQLYKRFIDDLFLIWTGSVALLCEFRKALAMADNNISLDWTGYESQEQAMDPNAVATFDHGRAIFLDLDMGLKFTSVSQRFGTTFRVIFRPYRKPGNAYAYIPFNSFHGRHTFRGWIIAEILRLLTHSSEIEFWQQEGIFFYHHLRARGYPRRFLQAVFDEVTWARRSQILNRTSKKEGNEFFEMYRACVLTLRNAPEWPLLKEKIDLRLTELIQSTCGDIFPPRVFLAQTNAPRLGSIIKK
jgi:hypothetical protein